MGENVGESGATLSYPDLSRELEDEDNMPLGRASESPPEIGGGPRDMELEGQQDQPETIVEVRFPQTHVEPEKFTDYEIFVQTSDIAFSRKESRVRRRYSEFDWLHKRLSSSAGIHIKVPPLPPKQVLGRFDDKFIETRRIGLQSFLQRIVKNQRFLAEQAVHLFLQSTNNMEEIERMVEDKAGEQQPSYPDSTMKPEVLHYEQDPMDSKVQSAADGRQDASGHD